MRRRALGIAVVAVQSMAFLAVSASPANASGAYGVIDYPLIDGMSNSYGITAGPDGNLWFTACYTSACDGSMIGSISPSGAVKSYPVSGTTGWGPETLTTGPDGALWFTQAGPDGYIGRITTGGQISYPSPTLSYPAAITTGPDGNLWFTTGGAPGDGAPGSVGMMTTSGAVITYTGHGIDDPTDIVAGPDGNLWFTNWGNNTIGQITPSGTITEFTGTGISQPTDITVGPDGALWFTNAGNNSIGRITAAGVVTNYTGSGIDQPNGITSAAGALWFTNLGNNSIGQITTSGVVSSYTSAEIDQPEQIVPGPGGGLWFPNHANASIGELITATNIHTSSHWAGYVATPKAGGIATNFKDAQAVFTVPAVDCSVTPNSQAYHFVGIGGWKQVPLQAAGVAEGCRNGTPFYYGAIWRYRHHGGEKGPIDVLRTVNAGDTVKASAYYSKAGNSVTFTVADVTTSTYYQQPARGIDHSSYPSAEIISYGNLANQGTADFGDVVFSQARVIDTSQHYRQALQSTAFQTIRVGQAGPVTGQIDILPGPLTSTRSPSESAFSNMWLEQN
jgi:streptogramin lyase